MTQFRNLMSEISELCHLIPRKLRDFSTFVACRKKFKWSTYQFHIFPPQRKSISIKRTNSHAHTSPTSEVSAEKLKFDSASYRFKITMFIFNIFSKKCFAKQRKNVISRSLDYMYSI